MTDEDNLRDLNAKEVEDSFNASVLAGTICIAVLIVIGMAGAILVWAGMSQTTKAVHP